MDIETQRMFDQYFELFGSPGWKLFLEDLEKSKQDFNSVLGIDDAKELHKRQGMIEMINVIQNMQNLMEYAYEEQGSDV